MFEAEVKNAIYEQGSYFIICLIYIVQSLHRGIFRLNLKGKLLRLSRFLYA